MGELTDKIKSTVSNAVGNAEQESDNPDVRAEGDRQELKGDLQDKKGSVEGAFGNKI